MRLSKNSLFIISIGLIVTITTLAFFFPSVIDYKYSYVKMNDKKEEMEYNNNQLTQREAQIDEELEMLADLEKEKDEVYKKASKLKKKINEEDFELDMPSFLITMEQKALDNNVSLDINYNQMKTIENSGNNNEEEDDESNEDVANEEEEDEDGEVDKDKDKDNKKEEKDEEKESNVTISDKDDSDSLSEEQIEEGTIKIDGIDVTVIPVEVEGSYSNVRGYIEYLDEVGMIKPSSAILTSDEKEVKGTIILNIFHGEVF